MKVHQEFFFFYGIFCHAFEACKVKIIQNEGGNNLET